MWKWTICIEFTLLRGFIVMDIILQWTNWPSFPMFLITVIFHSASLPPPLIPTPVLLECWFLFVLDQCSQFGDVIREKSGTEAIRKGFLLAREEMWDKSSRQRTSPNRKREWRANLKKNEIRILSLSIFHSVSDRLSDCVESDYEFVTRFLSLKLFCFLRNVCALTRKFMLLDNPC